jgi:hypothetical protein
VFDDIVRNNVLREVRYYYNCKFVSSVK